MYLETRNLARGHLCMGARGNIFNVILRRLSCIHDLHAESRDIAKKSQGYFRLIYFHKFQFTEAVAVLFS